MFDGKAFGSEIVGVVKDYVGRLMDPITRRLEALEARADETPKEGTPGKDAEPLSSEQIVKAILSRPGAIDEAVQRYLETNPPPGGKDGSGQASFLIDRNGCLVATMVDGTVRDLGRVIGKDGEPGKPGLDGLGFDDLTVEHDGERGFTLRFVRGEKTKEFAFFIPTLLDRGVFQKDSEYQKGDAVSWGGSLWIAQTQTTSVPGDASDWRLAVKKGRDGKPGEPGKDARALAVPKTGERKS